jgi:hypothetical protein
MSETTRADLGLVRQRLRRTASRFAFADALAGGLVAFALLALAWTVAAGLEALLWLPAAGRVILLLAVLVPVAFLIARGVARPALQRAGVLGGLSEPETARRVGTRLPGVADRLLATLDLAAGRGTPAPAGLVDGAVAALTRDLAPVPFEEAASFERPRRIAPFAGGAALVMLVAFLVAPGPLSGASARLLSPLAHFSRPAPFALDVRPGHVTLAAGDSLVVVVEASGSVRPAEVTLEVEREGTGEAETVRLVPDAQGRFRATLRDVRQNLRYRAVSVPVETETFRVTVARRPSVRSLRLTVTPPAYARQPRQTLPEGAGDVAGLPGTRVDVAAAVDETVAEAYLDFGAGGRVPLAIQNGVARGSFGLRREGIYRIVLRSRAGLTNDDGADHRLTLLPDAPPSITLAAPAGEAPLQARNDLDVRVGDDYGFSRLVLHWRPVAAGDSAGAGRFFQALVPLPSSRPPAQAVRYGFTPRVAPGASVEYYLEVWDNNAAGAQAARTPVQRLRAATAEQRQESLEGAQEATEDAFQELEQEAEGARNAFEQLRRELRDPTSDAARQALDSLRAREQRIQEHVERVAEQAQDVANELREQNASEEVQQEQQQLQRTLEELADPELRQVLQELQEALREGDYDRVQQATERYEQREGDLRERLEQARALLERLRVRQEIEQTAQQAEAVAEQQERLQQATRELEMQQQPQQGESAAERQQREQQAERMQEQIAQEQQRTAEQAEQFEQRLQQLEQRMQNTPRTPRQEMQQLRQQVQQQDPSRQMERAAEQVQQGQTQEAQQQQEQAEQQMRQYQRRLQEMQQGMGRQQQQLNAAALRRALDSVLRLSEQQEALRLRTQRAGEDSPTVREAARRQEELAQGLRTVSDTLGNVARRAPIVSRAVQQNVGEALREMEQARAQLGARQPQPAAAGQRAAMTQLNELALKLTALLQQAMNPQSGQGSGQSLQQMLDKLQQMGQQQQQMNEQTQQMINQQQGERLRPDQGERAQQMARQQAQMRRELRQMSRNPESRGRMLGDLEEAAREMEEVRRELESGRVSREMQDRQRRILTRLLEAQKSLNQRGQDERREGRRPGAVDADGPRGTPPPPPTPDEQLRRDLLRALDADYTPELERLIRRYLERVSGGG